MADAHGSGPCVGNNMRVQVPSPALKKTSNLRLDVFLMSYDFICFFRFLFSYILISASCKYSEIIAKFSTSTIPILA